MISCNMDVVIYELYLWQLEIFYFLFNLITETKRSSNNLEGIDGNQAIVRTR